MTAIEKIDEYIAKNNDWRGELITRIRKVVHDAAPGIVEEWKWNCPVWSMKGMVCSASAFKTHVGINFFQGAFVNDEHGLFTGGLDAKNSRSVKLEKGDTLNEPHLEDLIKAAVAYNNTSKEK